MRIKNQDKKITPSSPILKSQRVLTCQIENTHKDTHRVLTIHNEWMVNGGRGCSWGAPTFPEDTASGNGCTLTSTGCCYWIFSNLIMSLYTENVHCDTNPQSRCPITAWTVWIVSFVSPFFLFEARNKCNTLLSPPSQRRCDQNKEVIVT